jgi:hypothetical protein
MIWLMYRLAFKAVDIVAMQPAHYRRGAETLTVPE